MTTIFDMVQAIIYFFTQPVLLALAIGALLGWVVDEARYQWRVRGTKH